MLIPGFILSIITFPGVIVHEIAHQLFCRLFRLAVFEVCYFRVGNPAGYVVHEIPRKTYQQILIGVGPFFVNTVLGAIIAAPAALPVIKFGTGNVLDYFLIWLGVSIVMHSFPSIGDAKSIWSTVKGNETPLPLKIVTVPIIGLICIGSLGSIFWLDLIYGLGVVMLIPNLLVWLLV